MPSHSPSAVQPTKCVYVFTTEHGAEQKYKLVVKGDLRGLGTRRIKRCLEKATGVPAAAQTILLSNEELPDEWDGEQIGLFDGAALAMRVRAQRGSRARESTAIDPHTASAVDLVPGEGRATSRCLTFADDPPERPSRGDRERSGSSTFFNAAVSSTWPSVAQRKGPESTTAVTRRALPVGPYSREVSVCSHAGAAPPTAQRPAPYEVTARLPTGEGGSRGRPSSLAPPRTSSTASSVGCCSHAEPRVSTLAAENEAVRRENALLRDRLLSAERRAAGGDGPGTLQEQIEELENALLEKEAETAEAVEAAVAAAHAKEAELVRELARLREERRRLRQECTVAEEGARALEDGLRARLQAQQAELQDRDEVIAQLRACLAGYQSADGGDNLGLSAAGGLHTRHCSSPACHVRGDPHLTLDVAVQAALDRLALVFDAGPLTLDANNTCVLRVDAGEASASGEPVNLLVTLDGASGRLYLYSTLLSELPTDDGARLRLYEGLLEGALLGKDMCGAGVGVSTESGLLLMSTSVDVRRSDPDVLAAMARPFVSAVRDWTLEARRLSAY